MPTPSSSSGFEAVLFDLDGTLIEYDRPYDDVFATAFDRVGVDPFCDWGQFTEAARDVHDAETTLEFYRQTYRIAAERHDGPVDAVGDLAKAYNEGIDHTEVSFRPGAERALELARESHHVGLVTNGDRETQGTKLDALDLYDAFDTSVFAGGQGHSKPHPQPFLTAVDDLAVPTDAAYYVGNSLAHDVVGAKRAGLGAGWYPHDYDLDDDPADFEHRPDHHFETLGDLESVLEGSV